MDKVNRQKKMSLKERLIAQKQERLNQDYLNRQEEKRLIVTSLPYNEGEKKKPHKDGTFYKSTMPSDMAEVFKRLSNPDIDKMKSAHVRATNLGPGIPDNTLNTFRLLKQDPQLMLMQKNQDTNHKNGLANLCSMLVRQREEFNQQIRDHNEEQELRYRIKKETQKANSDFWKR